jgi:hypothetical protein
MKIDLFKLRNLVTLLYEQQLLSNEEWKYANEVSEAGFPFARQLEIADSVHYHIHVEDVLGLPHELLKRHNGTVANQAEGYIKYAFDGGINLIFSHIPVAQKEKTIHKNHEAYLDHIGIDIRSDDKPAYIAFQQIPLVSAQHDFLFTRQGDGKEAVKCCHMQVNEKYWVYPNEKLNYEFAFGPLIIHEGGFGIDLRPANPFNKITEETTSCCGAKKAPSIFIN